MESRLLVQLKGMISLDGFALEFLVQDQENLMPNKLSQPQDSRMDSKSLSLIDFHIFLMDLDKDEDYWNLLPDSY